jgi:hypothetical protein
MRNSIQTSINSSIYITKKAQAVYNAVNYSLNAQTLVFSFMKDAVVHGFTRLPWTDAIAVVPPISRLRAQLKRH